MLPVTPMEARTMTTRATPGWGDATQCPHCGKSLARRHPFGRCQDRHKDRAEAAEREVKTMIRQLAEALALPSGDEQDPRPF